jgi:hypothetical protein
VCQEYLLLLVFLGCRERQINQEFQAFQQHQVYQADLNDQVNPEYQQFQVSQVFQLFLVYR